MIVYVRLLSNKRLAFEVDETTVVGKLKHELTSKYPMESGFELVFDGVCLGDGELLVDCGVVDGDVLILSMGN